MHTLAPTSLKVGALTTVLLAAFVLVPSGVAEPQATVPDGFVAWVTIPDNAIETAAGTLVGDQFTVDVWKLSTDDNGDGAYQVARTASPTGLGPASCDGADAFAGDLSALVVAIENDTIHKVATRDLGDDCRATFDESEFETDFDQEFGQGDGFAVTVWTPTNGTYEAGHHNEGRLSSYLVAKNSAQADVADALDASTRDPALTSFTPIYTS